MGGGGGVEEDDTKWLSGSHSVILIEENEQYTLSMFVKICKGNQ